MVAAGPVLTRPMTHGCVGEWYRSVSSGGQGLMVPEARMGAIPGRKQTSSQLGLLEAPQEMPRSDVRGDST